MANHQSGKLYVISGPSGTGKGTICKELTARGAMDISTSMTTRDPRPGEVDGKDYFFVTKEQFEENIAKGEMLEWANVFGNMYGTPKAAVMQRLERGRNVILEIDVQGGLQVKKVMPEAILIFILPPSLKILKERLVGRNTDAPEVIERRLAEATNEIKLIGEYDYYVINDKIRDALTDFETIIRAEKLKITRNKNIINEVINNV